MPAPMQSGGVCREARSEVSGTAKGGTDGQEVQKEAQSGGSRWHNTPKTIGMPVEVNSAAVRWSNVQLPGEISPLLGDEKSAEVIVVGNMSRGRDVRLKQRYGHRELRCLVALAGWMSGETTISAALAHQLRLALAE